ncbi:MAG: hypothetical protein IKV68_06750, partial [Oscillospiraceae bacterium]|nr:hypothetical protein [Oscillospiraceae bacterium]
SSAKLFLSGNKKRDTQCVSLFLVREAVQPCAMRCGMHSSCQKSIALCARIFGASWIEPRFQLLSPSGRQKNTAPDWVPYFLVREAGLEPARP